jgi:hypothetical protein
MPNNTISATPPDVFQALRRKVYGDPALQAQLFEWVDAGEFSLALRQVAGELGLELDEDTLHQALQAGNRAWHERQLP